MQWKATRQFVDFIILTLAWSWSELHQTVCTLIDFLSCKSHYWQSWCWDVTRKRRREAMPFVLILCKTFDMILVILGRAPKKPPMHFDKHVCVALPPQTLQRTAALPTCNSTYVCVCVCDTHRENKDIDTFDNLYDQKMKWKCKLNVLF